MELVGSEWHLIQDGPLDYEEYPSYLIGLRHGATQRGVIIEVGDVNDNDPLITNNPDGELNNPYNEHEVSLCKITNKRVLIRGQCRPILRWRRQYWRFFDVGVAWGGMA